MLQLLSATIFATMDPACPCIDAAPLFAEANLIMSSRQTVMHNCSAGSIFDVGGQFGCLPPDYGSLSCQKWDEPLFSCTENPAAWCQMPWCYVDRDACMRSDLDIQGSLMFTKLQRRLFYSYGTCGQSGDPLAFASTFNPITQELAGETLQVGIPTMDYPMHFKRNGDGNVVTGTGELFYDNSVPWEGSMIQYMDAILELSNFARFKYTYTSNNARLAKPSSKWTAVVYDVSNHALDFGGSDFWVTTERSAMSAFSVSYDIDLHYLWVPRPKVDDSFMKVATKVFIPFSPGLWMLLFAVTMMVSLVEVYIFRDEWRNDGHDEWKAANGLIAKVKVVVFHWMTYLGKALIHITAGLDGTGSCDAQTIMYAGWSFFILITISAYTANLAAYMLRNEAGTYIASMEAAVYQRSVVCVAVAVKAELQARYPGARLQGVSFTGDLVEEYRSNRCDAVVWSMPVVKRSPSTARFMCDMDLAAVDVVLELAWAFPASERLAPSLSYWLVKARTEKVTYLAFESQYYMQSCLDVGDGEAVLSGTASQTGRRLKGGRAGAASGAAASGGGASGSSDSSSFTQIDTNLQSSGLQPLGVTSFTGVCLILAGFATWAMIRSVYNHMEDEGINDGMLKSLSGRLAAPESSSGGKVASAEAEAGDEVASAEAGGKVASAEAGGKAARAEAGGKAARAEAGGKAARAQEVSVKDLEMQILRADLEMHNFKSQMAKRMAVLEGAQEFSDSYADSASVGGGARTRRSDAPPGKQSPESSKDQIFQSPPLPFLSGPSSLPSGPGPLRELELEMELSPGPGRRRRSPGDSGYKKKAASAIGTAARSQDPAASIV